MSDDFDPNSFMSESFPMLIAELQGNDVKRFEEDQRKQKDARAALRRLDPDLKMTAGELLKSLDGDPELSQRKVDDELARINKEAQASVAARDKKNEPLPVGHFPAPPEL